MSLSHPLLQNSTTDLSVYRLSAKDLVSFNIQDVSLSGRLCVYHLFKERRHLLHVSKNMEAARKDLYDHPKLTSKYTYISHVTTIMSIGPSPLTPSTNNNERKTVSIYI